MCRDEARKQKPGVGSIAEAAVLVIIKSKQKGKSGKQVEMMMMMMMMVVDDIPISILHYYCHIISSYQTSSPLNNQVSSSAESWQVTSPNIPFYPPTSLSDHLLTRTLSSQPPSTRQPDDPSSDLPVYHPRTSKRATIRVWTIRRFGV